MQLDRVEIKNFRSIKEITLNFNPTCRVLVGINESGKSNILNALSLLGKEYNPDKKRDLREILPDEENARQSFVEFVFKFTNQELDKLFEILSNSVLSDVKNPDIISFDGDNRSIKDFCNTQNEALYNIDILEQSKLLRYWELSKNEFSLLDGWKKPTNSCPSDFQVELRGQKYNLADYRLIQFNDLSAIPKDYLENANLEDLEKVIGEGIKKIAEKNLLDVIFWEYKVENLLPNAINIDNFIANPDSCIPLKNMFFLSGIKDISNSLQEIRTESSNRIKSYLNRIAHKTTRHFKAVWKDYKNVRFSLRLENNQIIPGIEEKNIYDFDRRSDGFKRFITFLLMISVRVRTDQLKNTLLLVDEAEISLHPSGARYLRDELIKISNENYVVYSTHSIFMIDSGSIGRHYIVRKENEITTINEAMDSNIKEEEVLYNALDFSVFEILKEKNIIFEGWRDKHLFQIFLESSPKSLKKQYKNISFCHATGVKTIKKITPMIELAKRKSLVISDSDKIGKQYQTEYKKEKGFGDWKTYQDVDPKIKAITAEDFIKNEFIAEQTHKVLSKREDLNFEEGALLEKNKLKNIKAWLNKQGVQEEEQNDMIGKIKNLVFKNLKYENINDEYKKLLEGVLCYFSKV